MTRNHSNGFTCYLFANLVIPARPGRHSIRKCVTGGKFSSVHDSRIWKACQQHWFNTIKPEKHVNFDFDFGIFATLSNIEIRNFLRIHPNLRRTTSESVGYKISHYF